VHARTAPLMPATCAPRPRLRKARKGGPHSAQRCSALARLGPMWRLWVKRWRNGHAPAPCRWRAAIPADLRAHVGCRTCTVVAATRCAGAAATSIRNSSHTRGCGATMLAILRAAARNPARRRAVTHTPKRPPSPAASPSARTDGFDRGAGPSRRWAQLPPRDATRAGGERAVAEAPGKSSHGRGGERATPSSRRKAQGPSSAASSQEPSLRPTQPFGRGRRSVKPPPTHAGRRARQAALHRRTRAGFFPQSLAAVPRARGTAGAYLPAVVLGCSSKTARRRLPDGMGGGRLHRAPVQALAEGEEERGGARCSAAGSAARLGSGASIGGRCKGAGWKGSSNGGE